jgi:uncharacterized integral membrane protein/Tfp pilus assembly protein PilF
MIGKLNKVIVILIIVAAVAAIIVQNLDPVTVQFSPGTKISAVGGVILLASFSAGILLTLIVASFFAFRGWVKEKRLQRKQQQLLDFYGLVKEARALASSGQLKQSEIKWRKILKIDPTDVIARSEISNLLEQKGEPRDALKVIEEGRAKDSSNAELLFRASELNMTLGNLTAAADNLALLLYHHPSKKAARNARDVAKALDRYSDAIEYNTKLRELGADPEECYQAELSLRFKQILKLTSEKPSEKFSELKKFIKSYPKFPPALTEIARSELETSNYESAAEYFIAAAKLTQTFESWGAAVRVWLMAGEADRAVACSKTACRHLDKNERAMAELALITLLLSLEQREEAKTRLDAFKKLVASEELILDEVLKQRHALLRGFLLSSEGKGQDASRIWRELIEGRSELGEVQIGFLEGEHARGPALRAPSPVLSTP